MTSSSNTGLARRPAAATPAPPAPTNGTALAARLAPAEWTREYLDVLKSIYGKGTTDAEFALAVQFSKATGLRIDTRELWVYKRNANEPATITPSIDGFRAIAQSSGVFGGEEGPFWCGRDGVWRDVWLEEKAPVACRVLVYRTDVDRPFVGLIHLAEFRTNSPFWTRSPLHQSATRAAIHGYRKAYRREIGQVEIQARMMGVPLGGSESTVLASLNAPELATPYDPDTGEILTELSEPPRFQRAAAPAPRAAHQADADRTLEIEDLPPTDEPGEAADTGQDADEAEDVAYLEAASVPPRPRAAPVQAALIDTPAPEAPRTMTVQQARARPDPRPPAPPAAAKPPKTRAEMETIYDHFVARAQACGVGYTPVVQFGEQTDEQFRVAANDLARRVQLAERALQAQAAAEAQA